MGRLGIGELLLIFAALLLLFGATRLPQLGSALGSAIRNFKRGFGGEDEGAGPDRANLPTGRENLPTDTATRSTTPEKR